LQSSTGHRSPKTSLQCFSPFLFGGVAAKKDSTRPAMTIQMRLLLAVRSLTIKLLWGGKRNMAKTTLDNSVLTTPAQVPKRTAMSRMIDMNKSGIERLNELAWKRKLKHPAAAVQRITPIAGEPNLSGHQVNDNESTFCSVTYRTCRVGCR
jgi:hypothetical protein